MTKKFKLEKRELLYAGLGIVVLLLWFLYLKELISPYLINLFPFVAMLVYNAGTIIGLFLISSVLNTRKTQIKATFMSWLFLLGEDLIMAPYIVDKFGIINKSTDMWYVATDSGFASLYNLFLTGYSVWILTYIVTPILLMFIIPIIIASPKIIRRLLP